MDFFYLEILRESFASFISFVCKKISLSCQRFFFFGKFNTFVKIVSKKVRCQISFFFVRFFMGLKVFFLKTFLSYFKAKKTQLVDCLVQPLFKLSFRIVVYNVYTLCDYIKSALVLNLYSQMIAIISYDINAIRLASRLWQCFYILAKAKNVLRC